MTLQKRLSLIYQAAFLMEGDAIGGTVNLQRVINFTESVKLLAIQSDGFIAINAEGLAEGLGLPLRLFANEESEVTNG